VVTVWVATAARARPPEEAMRVARPVSLAAAAAPALALAQAEPSPASSYGWLWALVTIAVVLALFLVLFKRRPPLGRQGPGPARDPGAVHRDRADVPR
jgi:hypothetical protein